MQSEGGSIKAEFRVQVLDEGFIVVETESVMDRTNNTFVLTPTALNAREASGTVRGDLVNFLSKYSALTVDAK